MLAGPLGTGQSSSATFSCPFLHIFRVISFLLGTIFSMRTVHGVDFDQIKYGGKGEPTRERAEEGERCGRGTPVLGSDLSGGCCSAGQHLLSLQEILQPIAFPS